MCGSPDCGLLYFIMDFIVKNKWINELHLKGNKLMLYAMIHAYCIRYGEYSKGILYLSKCLGINKSTVIDCLKWLCEKGLLIKSVQPVADRMFIKYQYHEIHDINKPICRR